MARSLLSVCCKQLTRTATQANVNVSAVFGIRSFSDGGEDQGKPKLPVNSFFLYRKNVRAVIEMKYPNASVGQISKIAGEMYKNLDEADKQKLVEESKRLMEEYKSKKEEWMKSLSEEEKLQLAEQGRAKRQKKEKRLVKKLQKASGMPKKPRNSFLIFQSELWQSQYEDKKHMFTTQAEKMQAARETTSQISKLWQEMSAADKQVYIDMAKQESEEYKAAMKEWENDMVNAGNQKLVRKGSLPKPKTERKPRQRRRRKVTSTKAKPKTTEVKPKTTKEAKPGAVKEKKAIASEEAKAKKAKESQTKTAKEKTEKPTKMVAPRVRKPKSEE